MSSKRILITAGGTGGHLYPAQALAQELNLQSSSNQILFVAGGLATNRYFDRQNFSFQEVACSPLLSYHPLKCLRGINHLFKGLIQSIQILKNYRPDLVVGFGSYYTVSTLLAARWLNIPIVLHEANSVPGKANKWLAPFALCIGIHFPSTASFFKTKTVEVGLPLRQGYCLNAFSREAALSYYGLSSEYRTLLICGGSQGAHAINELVENCIPTFQRLSLQIIHLTGNSDKAKALASLYHSHKIKACVKSFESQMHLAWRAADAFVGRSGASTIAESIEFEVPGLLIPFPHATDQHQEKNADFLVQTVKSAWKLLEPKVNAEELGKKVEELFENQQYAIFKESLKNYKQRPQQLTLSQLICNLLLAKENAGLTL